MVYAWIAVAILALLVECVVPGLVAVWFVPAALISLLLAALNLPVWLQILSFVVVGIATLVLARFVFKKFGVRPGAKTNLDTIIGEKCLVTEHIDNLAGCGLVKVHGMVWSARALDEKQTFEPGDVVIIRAIQGVKVIVTSADNN